MADARRIQHIGFLTDAARKLSTIPEDVLEAIYEQVERHVGQDLKQGPHVEVLHVSGEAFRVDLFADADGTLWVTNVERSG